MGKTKIKTIDLSQPDQESKKGSAKSEHNKAVGEVEQKEITKGDAEMTRGDSEEGSRRVAAASKASEDARRETKLAGPRASKPRGKKYQEARQLIDPNQKYSLPQAIELTQKASYSKFPGTLEAHINTNAKNLRGLVPLPFLSGKKLTTEYGHSPTTYKTESIGQVIHLAVGKVGQSAEEIAANVKILVNTIGKSKIRKITLSPTMGPGVKVDLASI